MKHAARTLILLAILLGVSYFVLNKLRDSASAMAAKAARNAIATQVKQRQAALKDDADCAEFLSRMEGVKTLTDAPEATKRLQAISAAAKDQDCLK